MSCGVGCRHGSDPALLWLWHRPVAAALTRPLACEPPYAVGVALEKAKKKEKWIIEKSKSSEHSWYLKRNSSEVQYKESIF